MSSLRFVSQQNKPFETITVELVLSIEGSKADIWRGTIRLLKDFSVLNTETSYLGVLFVALPNCISNSRGPGDDYLMITCAFNGF